MNNAPGVQDFSFLDPAVQECPFAFYKQLRREAPVYWADEIKCFIVSTYDIAKAVFADTDTFSSVNTLNRNVHPNVAERIQKIRDSGYPRVPFLATNDPPTHTAYRKLSTKFFLPKRINALKDVVDTIVADLVDPLVKSGRGDFMAAVAVPLPLTVVAEWLSIPKELVPSYRRWADASIGPLNAVISEEQEIQFAQDVLEFQNYFAEILRDRMENPKDDLLTELVNAEMPGEGRKMTMPELLAAMEQFVVAGGETTTYTLGNAALVLARQPELLKILRQSDERLENFIEEVLRTYSPSQGLYRVVTKDTVLAGVSIPKGSIVSVRIGAANRDESVFTNSDELDVCRRNAKSHLTFGSGIHFCMGAPLARMEMFSVLRRLIHSVDAIALDADAGGFAYVPSIFFLALHHLNLKFH